MDEDIVEDKKCPICSKNIRSDADIHEYCKLCGMGIPELSEAFKIQTKYGAEYFCCDKCFNIYKEVKKIAIDPICKMKVDEKTAQHISKYNGKKYYFCAPGCKKMFDENPDKYVDM